MKIKTSLKKTISVIEKFLPLLCVLFFVSGIWLSRISETFTRFVDKSIGNFINNYQFFAPLAIYLIITPSFARILSERKANGKGFVKYSMKWFAVVRLIACVWACIFTAVVFGLPLYINHTVGLGGAISNSLKSMGSMLLYSPYFYALYAAAITILIAMKYKWLEKFLTKGSDLIEKIGVVFVPIVPFFMLFIGSYIAHLSVNVQQQLGEGAGIHLNIINILGFKINCATPAGMIMVYIAGSLLTGIGCFIWQMFLLIWAKIVYKKFSFKDYFKNYWIKVYPMLWATGSEALATPLNLYLVRKNFNIVRTEVRRFVIGFGSFVNINGTIICVYILAGLVIRILGIQVSLLDLLFSIGVVFLIGYGVPGIPGELLIFGAPMAVMLRIQPDIVPIFLALYLGLQIGLPDSFRSGANSTDSCATAIILQSAYETKFLEQRPEVLPEFGLAELGKAPAVVPVKEKEVHDLKVE